MSCWKITNSLHKKSILFVLALYIIKRLAAEVCVAFFDVIAVDCWDSSAFRNGYKLRSFEASKLRQPLWNESRAPAVLLWNKLPKIRLLFLLTLISWSRIIQACAFWSFSLRLGARRWSVLAIIDGYQTRALITALRLGRTTWLGSMYDSTDLVDNYYKLFTTIMVNLQTI